MPRRRRPDRTGAEVVLLALTFSCRCGASIKVPDVLAGHEGRCPSCDATLRAPAAAGTSPAPPAPPVSESDPGGVRVVTATPGGVLAPATKARLALEFSCPSCKGVLRVALVHAGRQGRCSLCDAVFDVPTPPAPPAADGPAAEPGARSARDAFKVVRVACVCGRQVAAPLARLEQGQARCPTCDHLLAP